MLMIIMHSKTNKQTSDLLKILTDDWNWNFLKNKYHKLYWDVLKFMYIILKVVKVQKL
jgi:hypothetical protein